jgi:dolichol-phosphate mannosyltransferase
MRARGAYISVIMPALNEETSIIDAIENTLSAFLDYNIKGEIIVVNDGSTDRTEALVRGKMDTSPYDKIRLVNHDEPKGLGVSFWDGLRYAEGEIVTMFPGDNENDPWEVLRYAGLLEHVDMVIPFVFNRQVRTIFRNALSAIYRFIINTTFGVNFNYTNGTILYRRSILYSIKHRSGGFFFQTEILIKMAKRGYLFAEVPYRLGMRPDGISKAVSFPSFLQVARGYLRLINDIYFNKITKVTKGRFSKDSKSAERKKANDK